LPQEKNAELPLATTTDGHLEATGRRTTFSLDFREAEKYFSTYLLIPFALTVLPVSGEDWTTTDGKSYKSVTVVKVEADAVTILDSDGGALVPLQSLPSDLQKRFHYDPTKAKAAAQARKSDDIRSEQAMDKEVAQKQVQGASEQQAEKEQQKPHETANMWGTVYQKIPGEGLLVMLKHGAAPIDLQPGGLFLLKGMPDESDLADDQGVAELVYRSGSYTYISTQGVRRTVAVYTAAGPIPPLHFVSPAVNP
jgi:hypothetical protein